jgi:hypothetical protein
MKRDTPEERPTFPWVTAFTMLAPGNLPRLDLDMSNAQGDKEQKSSVQSSLEPENLDGPALILPRGLSDVTE